MQFLRQLLASVLILAIFLFAYLISQMVEQKRQWQEDAVRAGVAKWVYDAEGSPKFQFIEK